MAKNVDVSLDSIKEWFTTTLTTISNWLEDYFSRIDTLGIVAVSAIGVGFILLIVGLFLL